MERPAATPARLDEVRDGFELAHAMLASRGGGERPLSALHAELTDLLGEADGQGARRAATRMKARLVPADTRGLDARCKSLLAAEVAGATGRRWLSEAPPRPGFAAHPGVRACVRALATARLALVPTEGPAHAE